MTSKHAVAPTLQADALEKGFMSGDMQVPVLRGLSLDIYPGELTLVSGPSGCGKSTLLSLLSGLSAPDGGRVHALGQDVGHMTRGEVERFRLHHVGFVFQGFNLFPALTALEQVQLPLGYRGMRNRESEPLARKARFSATRKRKPVAVRPAWRFPSRDPTPKAPLVPRDRSRTQGTDRLETRSGSNWSLRPRRVEPTGPWIAPLPIHSPRLRQQALVLLIW